MITLHQVPLPTGHSPATAGDVAISLHIERGSVLWVQGPAGSSKTALLETLALQRPLLSGSMHILEQHIGPKIPHKTRTRLQRRISYLPAEPKFFEGLSLFDNIALPLELNHVRPVDIMKETGAILRWFQLEEDGHKHPSQANFTTLQRAACARALITQPALLLVDEPIFSISAALRELFFSTIQELTRNGTTALLAAQENTFHHLLPGALLSLAPHSQNGTETAPASPAMSAVNPPPPSMTEAPPR